MQMDEAGTRLPKNFIEAYRPGSEPPSGHIFSALADGNFIPAMGTLIRRRALEAVGGYDERLTFEDYDMWLCLAQRYDFVFCPGTVARYRIVSTSLMRTIFNRPTADHGHTLFLIHEKWLTSTLLNAGQRKLWAERLWDAAYLLYMHGDARACKCLWRTFILTRRPRSLLLAAVSLLGVSRARARRLTSLLGGSAE
jgi:GT2 family glycosyltransferase